MCVTVQPETANTVLRGVWPSIVGVLQLDTWNSWVTHLLFVFFRQRFEESVLLNVEKKSDNFCSMLLIWESTKVGRRLISATGIN